MWRPGRSRPPPASGAPAVPAGAPGVPAGAVPAPCPPGREPGRRSERWCVLACPPGTPAALRPASRRRCGGSGAGGPGKIGSTAKRRGVHVGHHRTAGRVRDVLCCNCKSATGKLGAPPDSARRAVAYPEGNPWKPTPVAPGVYLLPS
ncbi:endonuclease domain-containing protein [Streptomyces sp. NPDC059740]|uniref:endonuclease domain-containing protein n=1 Tax=Streptomyces sp. NPDC059740 TaxID=3346926 RepID=UPI00364DC0E5